MSGGATGLGGYIYQQDYLTYRVLASVVARTLDGGVLQSLQSFKIEGRVSESGPLWDLVLRNSPGGIQLLECKDTEIAKDDRAIFYKRVRREVASGVDAETIEVGWVTDREKQRNILTHLAGMIAFVDILYAANSGTFPNVWNLCISSVSISPLWTVGRSSRHRSMAVVNCPKSS
jgi:hypothetical protein